MSRLKRSSRRTIRTLLQLIASGALTAAVTALADGLDPSVSGLVMAGWMLVVTKTQNKLEEDGTIPTILPSPAAPGLPAPLIAPAPDSGATLFRPDKP